MTLVISFDLIVLLPILFKKYYIAFLKEISPGCSLEGLMLRLKLQYFGHLMQRVDSFEKKHYTCCKYQAHPDMYNI